MGNTAHKRTPFQIEKDRREVTSLYLRGKTQMEIARLLGLSRQQIGYDLKVIQGQWRQATAIDLDAAKMMELSRIDVLERVAWEAWERSQEDKETTLTKQVEGNDEGRGWASIRREGQNGNPAFLERISWCIGCRCKLLGLDSPIKVDKRVLNFTIEFDTPAYND